MTQGRVMLIDGNNVYGRAWFTINSGAPPKDSLKKTIALFKTMVVNLRKKNLTNMVIICWDGGKDPERLEMFPEYKKREEKPSDYYHGITLLQNEIEETCEQYIQVFMKNVEADDLIGTLARYYSLLGHIVLIASDDKDMLQLLDENTIVVHSKKGIIDSFKFKEMFNFLPALYVDYLAIIGDKVDNIPGVKGIGEVGAKELVQNFGSIEQIYSNIALVHKKYESKLNQNKQEAFLSKKLIELKTINIPTQKLLDPQITFSAKAEEFVYEECVI